MNLDTQQARVAYLAHLKAEFNRHWPSGSVRSSEPAERESFTKAKQKIDDLTRRIDADLL